MFRRLFVCERRDGHPSQRLVEMADVDAFLASLTNIPGIGTNAPPPKADPAELAEAATSTWGSLPASEGYAEDVEAVNLPPHAKAPPPPPAAVEPVPTTTIYEHQASGTVAAATSESEVTAVAAKVAWAPVGASSEAVSTAVAVARSDADLLFAEAEAAAELALLEAARSPDAAPELSARDRLLALEREQYMLQEESQRTINANIEMLFNLQRQLDVQRARLTRSQRRVRAPPVGADLASAEQHKLLEAEILELQRRCNMARDANARTVKRIATLADESRRLQHVLTTPEGTPYVQPAGPPRALPASARTAAGGANAFGGANVFGSANGLGGARARPQSAGGARLARPASAGAARGASPGAAAGAVAAHGPSTSKISTSEIKISTSEIFATLSTFGGGGVAPSHEVLEAQYEAAELKLLQCAQRRDTYQLMVDRLKRENAEFDMAFTLAQATLARERRRATNLRIQTGEARQAAAIATGVERKTTQRVAQQQNADKAALNEQQQTLKTTQASVLQFEVNRMSRNPSALNFEAASQAASQVSSRRNSHQPSRTASVVGAVVGADAFAATGSAVAGADGLGAQVSAVSEGAFDEPFLTGSRVDSGYGYGGGGGGASGGGAPGLHPSYVEEGAHHDALEATWQRIQRATGMGDPLGLIHKALEQLQARRQIDALRESLATRVAELNDDAAHLAARQLSVNAAVNTAAHRRFERLSSAVNAAEHELVRATGRLELSDAAFADAREAVARLRAFANDAATLAGTRRRLRAADPSSCEGEELPAIVQDAIDVVLEAVRVADADAAAVKMSGGESPSPNVVLGSMA